MDTIQAKQAYELRLAGNDDFDIASTLGVTVDEAKALVQSWDNQLPTPTNTEARREEIGRVDKWLSRVEAAYISKELPVDKAVGSFIKLSERRCKLLGLDAPTRAEIEATLNAATPGAIEAELNQLAADLGLND